MVGYSVPLDIYAQARDPDVAGTENQLAGITCRWICTNLNIGGDCKTQSGESLNVSEIHDLEVHVPKKRLTPYNVF